jgi:hypothetical protein
MRSQRAHFKELLSSIFAFFDRFGNLVLTHGYSKKSSKTDPREIKQAEGYRRYHFGKKEN